MWLYEIKNIVTGKVYIGQTIKHNVNVRWNEHRRALSKNVHVNKTLQNDWNLYGSSAFVFNVLKRCMSTKELDTLEKVLIAEHKVNDGAYNISEGGQVSRTVYFKTWNGLVSPTGKIYYNIENMENFAKRYNLDPDKLRQVSKGNRFSYKGWVTLVREKKTNFGYWKGKTMSTESNQKRSVSLRKAYKNGRKVAGEKLKKVYSGIISPEGAVYTNVVGLNAFCKIHNLHCGSMSSLCSGKIQNYKGWTYNPSVTLENK